MARGELKDHHTFLLNLNRPRKSGIIWYFRSEFWKRRKIFQPSPSRILPGQQCTILGERFGGVPSLVLRAWSFWDWFWFYSCCLQMMIIFQLQSSTTALWHPHDLVFYCYCYYNYLRSCTSSLLNYCFWKKVYQVIIHDMSSTLFVINNLSGQHLC